MWGTLIALLDDGVPVLGMLDQPITRERWLGVSGQPTTLNGAILHCNRLELGRSDFVITFCVFEQMNGPKSQLQPQKSK